MTSFSYPEPNGLVLDTDVTSFLFNQDRIRAPRYEVHTGGKKLYLPFAAVGEIHFGMEIRQWGPVRRARLGSFLQRFVVVQSDADILQMWAEIRAVSQRRGRMIERQDAWIAAVALTLNLPLVTHNAAHYAHIPLLQIITEPDRPSNF